MTAEAQPEPVVAEPAKPVAKPVKTAKAKAPVVESNDIASALTEARTDDQSEGETPIPQDQADTDDEQDEAVPLQVALPESESLTQAQANALQAPNANPAQATNTIPEDAQPLEQVQSVKTTGAVITRPANSNPIVSQNAQNTQSTLGAPNGTSNTQGQLARGLPTSRGSQGTTSGMTQSGGGTQGVGLPFGAQVRDARTLQAMPGNPLATYPLPDRIANREGTTVLLGHIRNDGHVENVTLEKSSGSRMMDESAAKAFSQWKYRPGQEGYVRLPMQFKLVGDAHVIPAQLNRE
jgi:TonB family protein